MCFFKRKKTVYEKIDSKFDVGDSVYFRYKEELYFGYVMSVRKNMNNEIVYSVQIGGECPVVIRDIKEEVVFLRK